MDDIKNLDDLTKAAKKWISDLFGEEGLFGNLKNELFGDEFDDLFQTKTPSNEEKKQEISPKIPWEKLPLPVKDEVEEAVLWPIIRKDLAKEYGIKMSKGVLLFGPPGCGKTLLMKALAKKFIDADIKVFLVHLSDILSKWYGSSEQKLKNLFSEALKQPPAFLFIDEFESIGRKREAYNMDDVTPRLLSMLLGLLDGMNPSEEVGIIASTNRVEFIDDALLRPGRFDKIIYVPPPDFHLRKEIFVIHGSGRKQEKIDYETLADFTHGFSGADITLVWEEASRIAMRRAVKNNCVSPIKMDDLVKVIEKLNPSIQENDLIKYEEMRRRFQRMA